MTLNYQMLNKLNELLNTMNVTGLSAELSDKVVELKETIEDALVEYQDSLQEAAEKYGLTFDSKGEVNGGDQDSFVKDMIALQKFTMDVTGFLSNNLLQGMYTPETIPSVPDRTFLRRVLLDRANKA